MPVFEILLVRGIMVLSISYMKAVTSTQNTFPYALGSRCGHKLKGKERKVDPVEASEAPPIRLDFPVAYSLIIQAGPALQIQAALA